ncbi:MAG: aspartate-semialdehyde dehydrogenase [Candidatus Ancaeobacter aquaticus]|nr:aspartate-semialdehyde dehydrogenase [Candidatus Ancaeobacter aquaticus]
MAKRINVAVVGATGAVGNEMLKILEERNFPFTELRLLASVRSKGKKLSCCGKEYTVEELTPDSFKDIDIALFSAGGSISKEFCPHAVKAGAICVDNTSQFRMDETVPLVVPEVNPQDISWHKGIIANPNCSTIQMVVALKPLHDKGKIKRVVVSTYQAVSGAGTSAVRALEDETREVLAGEEVTPKKFPYQIAFNLLPHIDVFLDNGYTKEEMKMTNETKKILGDDTVEVTATCVRVPVFTSHAESVNVETEKKISASEAREILSQAPGITVIDDLANTKYPLPIDATGKYDTYVGRIREDDTIPNGLNLWVVSDNLRKGAALNAVQIAELLISE